jgi:hypothetical protein
MYGTHDIPKVKLGKTRETNIYTCLLYHPNKRHINHGLARLNMETHT